MEENHGKGFKIFDDGEPEEELLIIPREEEAEPVAVPPSASKTVFVAVFAFCILGALLFFGYFQLSNRINRMESTGTHEIKGLNKEVDARLTRLSDKLAEQDTKLTKQVEALTKQVAALSGQSVKNAAAISSAEKVLTSTKQSASSNMNTVETRLSALSGRIGDIESTVTKDIPRINERLNTLSSSMEETRQSVGGVSQVRQDLQSLQSRFDTIASEIETLQAGRLEPDKVDQQITNLDQQLNRRLDTTEKKLQQTIASLGDEIDALEAMVKSFKKLANQAPSAGQNPSGGQGDIIEQEIK